jgi:Protein of unknown function (DUF2975)
MKALGNRSVASVLAVLVDIMWVLVGIGLAAAVCLVIVSLSVDLSGGNGQVGIPASFGLDTTALHVEAPSLGIEDAHLAKVNGRGVLQFRPPGRTFLAVTALVLVVSLAFVLWVLSQLRAVFRTLRAGTPFVPDNVTRIRRIGYALILGECARAVLTFIGNYQVVTHFSADFVQFTLWPDFSFTTILHGLLILVLAEVFRVGVRLDEDQSLTV